MTDQVQTQKAPATFANFGRVGGASFNEAMLALAEPESPAPETPTPEPVRSIKSLLAAHRELLALDEVASGRARTLADALATANASKQTTIAAAEAAKAGLEQAICTSDEPAAEAALSKLQAQLGEINKRINQLSGAIKALPENDYSRSINASRNAILRRISREEAQRVPSTVLSILQGAYIALASSGSSLEWWDFLAATFPQLGGRDEAGAALAEVLKRYNAEEV